MPDASGRQPGGARPRSVALIGPQGSGKSTLFDALLAAAGGPARRGGPRGLGTELRLGHAHLHGRCLVADRLSRLDRIRA